MQDLPGANCGCGTTHDDVTDDADGCSICGADRAWITLKDGAQVYGCPDCIPA